MLNRDNVLGREKSEKRKVRWEMREKKHDFSNALV